MGRNKRDLVIGGESLLVRTVRILTDITDDVLVTGLPRGSSVASSVRSVPDAISNAGPLAGLLAGLREVRHQYAVVVATDLPFLDHRVLRFLLGLVSGVDAVVPRVEGHPQPMQAVYAVRAVPAIERRLALGAGSLRGMLDDLRVHWVEEDELRAVDPSLRSFVNVNTPQEWSAALGGG